MIVLDTHVLVWWVNDGKKLSISARQYIKNCEKKEGSILVSSISVWEIAMLIDKGRIQLSMEMDAWLKEIGKIKTIHFVPVDNDIAIKATQLPGQFHKDPADRMIVSLARQFALPLLTADEKILHYPHVKGVW